MLCLVELAYSSPAAFNLLPPPVRVDSRLQLHCISDIMTCKPICPGMSKYMFEASGAVAFRGGARSMLDPRTWALYYKAQCSRFCFFFFSIFRCHCSFIDYCNHGQTISNLFASRINVAILPSSIYLTTSTLSGAIFRSHTSLPLFALLKLKSLKTSP